MTAAGAPAVALFTDFGLAGPYVGQMKAVLCREAPGVPAIDLMADAPTCDPRAAAYLLAALAPWLPARTIFLAVVDPGVGGVRRPLVLEAGGQHFVGPDNGLFELVSRRAAAARFHEIAWRPPLLSASFHGRDLFAPVAGRLAAGALPADWLRPIAPPAEQRDWPDDLPQVVYLDHFGNAMTGLRAALLPPAARLTAGGRVVGRGRTFGDVPRGEAFWYENSCGLAEIAVNAGRADRALGLSIGTRVEVLA
jgi:S-adenosylmethionine hydrolase